MPALGALKEFPFLLIMSPPYFVKPPVQFGDQRGAQRRLDLMVRQTVEPFVREAVGEARPIPDVDKAPPIAGRHQNRPSFGRADGSGEAREGR